MIIGSGRVGSAIGCSLFLIFVTLRTMRGSKSSFFGYGFAQSPHLGAITTASQSTS
ncbi:MAG: hypothetical protein IH792_06355, partial [Thaumarchaeota archaeon]|nr:hypothetical protein [Nitrososphaerota archaeon]